MALFQRCSLLVNISLSTININWKSSQSYQLRPKLLADIEIIILTRERMFSYIKKKKGKVNKFHSITDYICSIIGRKI